MDRPHDADPELPILESSTESEEKLAAVLAYSPAIILTVDRQLRIQSINRVRAGLALEAALGTSSLDYVLPEHRTIMETSLKRVFETGESSSYEIQGLGDNGRLAWYSTRLSLLNKGTAQEKVLLISEDITERKQAYEALRTSESRLRTITQNAPDVIAELDRNGRFTFMSRVQEGYDLKDVLGRDFCTWAPQEYHTVMRNTLEQVFLTGSPKEYEALGAGPNGSMRWYVVRLSPVIVDTRVERAILIAHDMTDRKRMEEALQESEARFRAVFESSQDAIGVAKQGNLVFINPAYVSLFGYAESSELIGRSVLELIAPAERDRVRSYVQLRARGESAPSRYETRGLRKDNSEPVLAIHVSTYVINGETYAVAVLRDITEQRLAEENLRKSEADLAEAQRVAHLGSWKFDIDANTVRWSEELFRIFDIERREFGGAYASFLDCVHPDDKQRVHDVNRSAMDSGASYEIEYRIVTRSGRLKHIRAVGHAIKNATGRVVFLYGVAQDITEQKRLEEERIRQKGEERAMTNLLMEIHDGIGGITSNISLLAELALRQPMRDDIKQKVTAISALARDGMAEIRSLMYGLDTEDLHWHSVIAELQDQGAKLLDSHHILFSMTADCEDGIPDPSSHLCLQLLRIYREAIINVIKHANATRVTVDLRVSRSLLSLEIHDDGQGFSETATTVRGRGIGNMKRRAEALRGSTTISGTTGTHVTVEIPLQLSLAR